MWESSTMQPVSWQESVGLVYNLSTRQPQPQPWVSDAQLGLDQHRGGWQFEDQGKVT